MTTILEHPAAPSGAEVATIFTHPRMTVTEVPFRENGRHVIVNAGTGLGAVIVPVVKHRGMVRIGFTRQYRPPVGGCSLELPRGGTRDLSAEEAARELTEELGVGSPAAVRQLGTLHPDTGLLSTEVRVWAAFIDHAEVEASRGHVDIESGGTSEWLCFVQALGRIHRGELKCGITLAALLMAQSEGVLAEQA